TRADPNLDLVWFWTAPYEIRLPVAVHIDEGVPSRPRVEIAPYNVRVQVREARRQHPPPLRSNPVQPYLRVSSANLPDDAVVLKEEQIEQPVPINVREGRAAGVAIHVDQRLGQSPELRSGDEALRRVLPGGAVQLAPRPLRPERSRVPVAANDIDTSVAVDVDKLGGTGRPRVVTERRRRGKRIRWLPMIVATVPFEVERLHARQVIERAVLDLRE